MILASLFCRELKLLQPIFKETCAYGHFGRPGFTWETPKSITIPDYLLWPTFVQPTMVKWICHLLYAIVCDQVSVWERVLLARENLTYSLRYIPGRSRCSWYIKTSTTLAKSQLYKYRCFTRYRYDCSSDRQCFCNTVVLNHGATGPWVRWKSTEFYAICNQFHGDIGQALAGTKIM